MFKIFLSFTGAGRYYHTKVSKNGCGLRGYTMTRAKGLASNPIFDTTYPNMGTAVNSAKKLIAQYGNKVEIHEFQVIAGIVCKDKEFKTYSSEEILAYKPKPQYQKKNV